MWHLSWPLGSGQSSFSPGVLSPEIPDFLFELGAGPQRSPHEVVLGSWAPPTSSQSKQPLESVFLSCVELSLCRGSAGWHCINTAMPRNSHSLFSLHWNEKVRHHYPCSCHTTTKQCASKKAASRVSLCPQYTRAAGLWGLLSDLCLTLSGKK